MARLLWYVPEWLVYLHGNIFVVEVVRSAGNTATGEDPLCPSESQQVHGNRQRSIYRWGSNSKTKWHNYVGTSNWSGDYFTSTVGIGQVISNVANSTRAVNETIPAQLNEIFMRDWNSQYSVLHPALWLMFFYKVYVNKCNFLSETWTICNA